MINTVFVKLPNVLCSVARWRQQDTETSGVLYPGNTMLITMTSVKAVSIQNRIKPYTINSLDIECDKRVIITKLSTHVITEL